MIRQFNISAPFAPSKSSGKTPPSAGDRFYYTRKDMKKQEKPPLRPPKSDGKII
jgi:hypothetical protein